LGPYLDDLCTNSRDPELNLACLGIEALAFGIKIWPPGDLGAEYRVNAYGIEVQLPRSYITANTLRSKPKIEAENLGLTLLVLDPLMRAKEPHRVQAKRVTRRRGRHRETAQLSATKLRVREGSLASSETARLILTFSTLVRTIWSVGIAKVHNEQGERI
jgi:hypothetical protein